MISEDIEDQIKTLKESISNSEESVVDTNLGKMTATNAISSDHQASIVSFINSPSYDSWIKIKSICISPLYRIDKAAEDEIDGWQKDSPAPEFPDPRDILNLINSHQRLFKAEIEETILDLEASLEYIHQKA